MPKLTPEPPRTWLATGVFATGELISGAPVHVVAAQEVAARLEAALAASGRSRAGVASDAGIARSTLYAILAGDVFPDFVSVARLGAELHADLWPAR